MPITIAQIAARIAPKCVKNLSTKNHYLHLIEEAGETPRAEDHGGIHELMTYSTRFKALVGLECLNRLEAEKIDWLELDPYDLTRNLNQEYFAQSGYTIKEALVAFVVKDVMEKLAKPLSSISKQVADAEWKSIEKLDEQPID